MQIDSLNGIDVHGSCAQNPLTSIHHQLFRPRALLFPCIRGTETSFWLHLQRSTKPPAGRKLLDLLRAAVREAAAGRIVYAPISRVLCCIIDRSLPSEGSWLWPDFKDALLKDGGLLQSCFPPSTDIKKPLTSAVLLSCNLAVVISKRNKDKAVAQSLLRVLTGAVGHLNAYLELAAAEYEQFHLLLPQPLALAEVYGALPVLPAVVALLLRLCFRRPDSPEGWATLISGLHPGVLRCWPALLAVLDATPIAEIGYHPRQRELPDLDRMRLLAAQSEATRAIYWARHWACSVDTLTRAACRRPWNDPSDLASFPLDYIDKLIAEDIKAQDSDDQQRCLVRLLGLANRWNGWDGVGGWVGKGMWKIDVRPELVSMGHILCLS